MSDVATVEVAPGVTVNAGMSPTEIFNAHARAAGAPTVERPVSRPQEHTTATLTRFAQLEAQATQKPREDGSTAPASHAGRTPPSSADLAAGNSRLEQFDAEMRSKGIATVPQPDPGRFVQDEHTGVTFDSAAVQRAHEIFASLPAAERDASRQEYQETLAEIYGGRLQLSDMEGSTAPEQPRDAQGRFAPPQSQTPTPVTGGWQSHVEDGAWVDIGKLTLADTSGYTIPRYVAEQRLNVSTFELLRQAKAAGISQEQINAVFHQQAIGQGWRKA